MDSSAMRWQPGTSWYSAPGNHHNPASPVSNSGSGTTSVFWDARPDYKKLDQILGLDRQKERAGPSQRRRSVDVHRGDFAVKDGSEPSRREPKAHSKKDSIDQFDTRMIATPSLTELSTLASSSSVGAPLADMTNMAVGNRLYDQRLGSNGSIRAFRRCISMQDSPCQSKASASVSEASKEDRSKKERTRTESLDSLIAKVSNSLNRTRKDEQIRSRASLKDRPTSGARARSIRSVACKDRVATERHRTALGKVNADTRKRESDAPGVGKHSTKGDKDHMSIDVQSADEIDLGADDLLLSEEMIAVLSQYEKPGTG